MQTKPTVEDAVALAALSHKTQVDKAGQPYIFHPLRMMLRFEDEAAQIVAVLHDVVEDAGIGFDDLRGLGYSEEIISALDCVTRRDGETYEQFIERAAVNPLARRVKLADLDDNLEVRRLPVIREKDVERLNRYKAAQAKLRAVSASARSTVVI
jgi:(p)ppGpp synthase/HD superfamily hydrolase